LIDDKETKETRRDETVAKMPKGRLAYREESLEEMRIRYDDIEVALGEGCASMND
jgi:hypothetical protein